MIRVIWVSVFFLQLFPVIAGPDSTTQRFMNDSPSMLEFGLFKLKQRLIWEGDETEFKQPNNVKYNWDKNTIEISSTFNKRRSRESAEKLCSLWFDYVRFSAGIVKSKTALSISNFARDFRHDGLLPNTNRDQKKKTYKNWIRNSA